MEGLLLVLVPFAVFGLAFAIWFWWWFNRAVKRDRPRTK
jgi:hypothetical protein